MKEFLFVKLDGIGDYLFFRLFWPQIAQIARQKQIQIHFLCSREIFSLAARYDTAYLPFLFPVCSRKREWVSGVLSFLPAWRAQYQLARQYRRAFRAQWDAVFNANTSRSSYSDALCKRLHAKQLFGVQTTLAQGNPLVKDEGAYLPSIYTHLTSVNSAQFILSYWKEVLEDWFKVPFTLPALAYPFSKEETLATARAYGLTDKYAVFVPFTSTRGKNWPLENFACVAKELAKHTSMPVVVLGTCCAKDKQVWKDIPSVKDLTNATPLEDALRLAAGASYALCSDTVLMHAALLGGAETVCVSGGVTEKLFLRYPPQYGVKQTIFLPQTRRADGLGDISRISPQEVWAHIAAQWAIAKG